MSIEDRFAFSEFNPADFLLRLLYLLLAFPLGIFYFVFLTVGIALGTGLLIIWVGLIILLLVLLGVSAFTGLERSLAAGMLGVRFPASPPPFPSGQGLFRAVKLRVQSPATWKGLLFLILKFPLGIASFVLTVFFVSICLALILSPFIYPFADMNVGLWYVDTLEEALICMLGGVLAAIVAVYVLNGLAVVWGRLALALLAPEPRQDVGPAPSETSQSPVFIQ